MVKLIQSEQDFESFMKENESKVIAVDYFAEWCGPCKQIAPVVDELSKNEEIAKNLVFCKIDVDEAEDWEQYNEVSVMPTFKFYKGGKVIDEFQGANTANLKSHVSKHSGVSL